MLLPLAAGKTILAADKLSAADFLNGYKQIPIGTAEYGVEGLIEVPIRGRAVKIYLTGNRGTSKSYIYNMVDSAQKTDNGYPLVEAADADGWIAFFGKTSVNADFVDIVKSKLNEVRVTGNGLSSELFYSYSQIAQLAGGASGDIEWNQEPDSSDPEGFRYKLTLAGHILYDSNTNGNRHSMSMTMPSEVEAGQPFDINLHVTDGSYFINHPHVWHLYYPVAGQDPVRLLDYAHKHVSGHSISETVSHTIETPGRYTFTFTIQDSSYHSNSSTGQTRYAISETITIVPAGTNPPPDPDPDPDPEIGPIADFHWSPSSPNGGETVHFRDDSTHPDGKEIVAWEWKVMGAPLSTEQEPVHVFEDAGFYDVSLTVTDEQGLSHETTQTVNVGLPNKPPVACFEYESPAYIGEPMQFDADCSYDRDGYIVEYEWDGDWSEIVDGDIHSEVITVIFDEDYDPTIMHLGVTDDRDDYSGRTDEISLLIPTPTAHISMTGALKVNRKVTFRDASSFPRSPQDQTKIDWTLLSTDGTPLHTVKSRTTLLDNHESFDLLFKEPGSFKMSLCVTNMIGRQSCTEQAFDIAPDLAPVARFETIPRVYRDANGDARLELHSVAASPDGDPIGERVWRYRYDSDNDQSFSDEYWQLLDDDNRITVTLPTRDVGNYEFYLYVQEDIPINQTIPEFITAADYLEDDTLDEPPASKKVVVDNLPPVVSW